MVELEVAGQVNMCKQRRWAIIDSGIHILVLHARPEAFHKNILNPSSEIFYTKEFEPLLRASARLHRSLNSMSYKITWDIKAYYRVRIAVDRLSKRFLHAVKGKRGALGNAIVSPMIETVMTDYWGSYEHFVTPGITHSVQS